MGEFRFKHFTLFHNQDSFSIGTDAMVLGALVQGQDIGRILDAGAGSGVLGLMAAQTFPLSHVDCVEIDEKAFLECQENLRKSPFHGRIHAIHSNLLDFHPKELYATIITNPPYYVSDNFSTPRNQREKHLSTEEIKSWFMHCSQLLAPQGTLWFIVPSSIKEAIE
ncbi:MAG: tRNA1(Val) (adenine(37)-N6)-methyltransferase [Bacteroidota bacterium]